MMVKTKWEKKILVYHIFGTCRSSDGSTLVASSTDGYCTIVTFGKDEIGEPYIEETVVEATCDQKVMCNRFL